MYEGLLRNLHPHLDRQLATQVEKVIDEVRTLGIWFPNKNSDGI